MNLEQLPEISELDVKTLSGHNWVNDSVINFYLALLAKRSKDWPSYPPVHYLNTFFYPALKKRGVKHVLKWTKNMEGGKNIFQFDMIFVPLHLGKHWALCVIDNRYKKIKYYDSLPGGDVQILKLILNYLIAEKRDKLGIKMDASEYSLEIVKDIPRQKNGSDCGIYTLLYAEFISRRCRIIFSKGEVPYYRRRAAREILRKRVF